jgi:hypothetical protein
MESARVNQACLQRLDSLSISPIMFETLLAIAQSLVSWQEFFTDRRVPLGCVIGLLVIVAVGFILFLWVT